MALTATSIAQASVIVDVTESNSNVYFQWNGSLDTANSVYHDLYGGWMVGAVRADYPNFVMQLSSSGNTLSYSLSSIPLQANFGPGNGGYNDLTSLSGNGTFAFDKHQIGVGQFYTSGSPITGAAYIQNQTIVGLGFKSGTFTWTLAGSGDTVVMTVVPEPSTYAMIGAGALGLLAMRRRRA